MPRCISSVSYLRLLGFAILLLVAQPLHSQSGHAKSDAHPIPAAGEVFPYDLSKIDKKYKLPDKAREISALSYLPKDTMIFVQDEAGKIFFFCKEREEIVHTLEFKKKGDFEGVEVLENTTYVLRSDGKIFEIITHQSEISQVSSFETPLSELNDTEGLAYDPISHSLLIACKGEPGTGESRFPGKRAVYRFDLKEYRLDESPFLLIDEAEIASKFHKKGQSYQPSGIAIHPISGDIYVIASVGQLLAVYTRDKQLKWVRKLDKDLFRHPEGICFSPKGNLYISNEGDNKKGNIVKVKYQP